MGYESRIYIVEVNRDKNNNKVTYAENIAAFNLCCMGYSNGWCELFKTPIDYDLYTDSGKITKDCYGEHLKSADIDTVIEWLENYKELEFQGKAEHYRGIDTLLATLKGFNKSAWSELQIVHYGY